MITTVNQVSSAWFDNKLVRKSSHNETNLKLQRGSCKLSYLSLSTARPPWKACSQAKTSGTVTSDREKIGQ